MDNDARKKLAAERVRALRESLGLDQIHFADHLKLGKGGQSLVSKWETATAAPGAKSAAILATYGGQDPLYYQGLEPLSSMPTDRVRAVKAVGEVQAGAWKEAVEWDIEDQYDWPIPPTVPQYDNMNVFIVRGTSMNLIYPDGSAVLVAGTIANRLHPQNDDIVLVQRVNDQGQHEASLKQYRVLPDGSKWLWPRSTDPEFQQPLKVESKNGHDVTITGIVVLDFILRARTGANR